MSTEGEIHIGESDIRAFEADGVVCLRGVIPGRWLERLAESIESAMASRGRYTRRQSNEGDPGLYFSDYWASERVPGLRAFALESPAAEIAAKLMRSERANFFFDGVWVKEPNTEKRSAWHQDQPYYCVDGRQVCIVWVPIDPVSEEVSLRCVRGSHRWSRMFDPIAFVDGRDFGRNARSLYEAMPDIDGQPDRFEALSWDLEPGDCIVFHGLTVHGARGNSSSTTRRRAVSTTWLGDDTVYIERPGEMEPHRFGMGLKPGDSLDCEHFPRAWPRPESSAC